MPDYDFYHGLYTGQQVDSAVARALVGGQLDQDIAAIRAAVGSPLVANTAAEMTNINKIYVYTGSEVGYSTGHWYYYEGGAWQDGGLYNSAAADDEMSDSSTNAVQNKVIKEYVDDVRTDLGSDIGDVRTDLGADILAEQTRAENVEALKAPLASPAFTGTPTAPTASPGDNSTQIATTAYADNAVAAEKARAEAVEATKADKSYADYILLREEEDRQILMGSIVEAAEDSYPELRSAPIHNAITIGQSVYPRMDRTRMAIDAIRGRTVAFNQLCDDSSVPASSTSGDVTFTFANHVLTINGTASSNAFGTNVSVSLIKDHIYYKSGVGGNEYATSSMQIYTDSGEAYCAQIFKAQITENGDMRPRIASGQTLTNAKTTYQLIDLTADYGTTLADSIYALEQATTGAGVAYVRQRMDSDYYAANAGTLSAPVVSGVNVVGFNFFDEDTAFADYGTKQSDGSWYISNPIPISGNAIWENKAGYTGQICVTFDYKYTSSSIGLRPKIRYTDGTIETMYTGAYTSHFEHKSDVTNGSKIVDKIYWDYGSGAAGTYIMNVCVSFSSSRNGEFVPYQHTSLTLPSTRLDGVGTAQDYIEVVEDGENDYSLHPHKVMEQYTFTGSETWSYNSESAFWGAQVSVYSAKYWKALANNICTNGIACTLLNSNQIRVYNVASDADMNTLFKSGTGLCYELLTPTESVIAEHLTLADISAIAENGGIISIVNENGHIVQPDLVADVVISRSAS